MKNICLISDTHGKIETWVFKHFEDSDEIWHCGDLGSISIINSINKNFKFRAVYGNIDNAQIRRTFKKDLVFKVEDIKVLMTHIAGPVKKYNAETLKIISNEKPQLLVCGHSHILKVIYDKNFDKFEMYSLRNIFRIPDDLGNETKVGIDIEEVIFLAVSLIFRQPQMP